MQFLLKLQYNLPILTFIHFLDIEIILLVQSRSHLLQNTYIKQHKFVKINIIELLQIIKKTNLSSSVKSNF